MSDIDWNAPFKPEDSCCEFKDTCAENFNARFRELLEDCQEIKVCKHPKDTYDKWRAAYCYDETIAKDETTFATARLVAIKELKGEK